ncbi:hypothetical protein KUTeg_019135 [Tegillarca granosa]|uniref:C-type lectin domain-containing protein n=1 Tax=Tegillarca granosa TaxID=220873 RepID=A0ABQ9EBL8_TEGGR|nr:hypothetical protein KUTeg_019135 [Tegillarca granosa]
MESFKTITDSTNSGQIIQTVYENQLSWTEARRKCKANQEDLSSFFKEVPIGNLIENNRYWIGLYRSRNIIYNDVSVTSTKAIITTQHTIPVDNSNTIKAGLIGGALGLSVVLVLVCFGVCFGCFRFHNRKRPIKRRKLTQSTSNKISEGDDDVFIVPESDKDIKPKSYPPPVKPARRRSSAARVSYENVPLVEYKESETMKDKTHSDNLRKDNDVVAVEISTDSNAPKLETSASNISLPGDILGNSVYDYASQVENKSTKPNLEEVHSYEMVNNEAEYVTTADDVYDIMNEKRPKNPEKITENIYDQTSCDLYDSTIKQGSVTLDSQYDSTTAFKHQLM